jgi:putative ABC transport system substrate-binding protein
VKRREMLTALAALGAAAGTLETLAQTAARKRPFRIGFAGKVSPEARERIVTGMREFGWQDRVDYLIVDTESAHATVVDEDAIRQLVNEKPDLIMTVNTANAIAAHRFTKTIPIVMFTSGYPVEAGIANSLARPGKNVTGNSIYAGTGVWGKLLELLRDSKRNVKRVGVLWSYVSPPFPKEEIEPCYRELRAGAAMLGMSIHIVDVTTQDSMRPAMDGIASSRPDALVLTSSLRVPAWDAWSPALEFALKRKLPTIVDYLQSPEDKRADALLTYSPNLESLRRQAYGYIDRILKGANPGDLPIQLPSKFDFVVDLRTARAIGLAVPQSLLARADRVIE